jgi:hypothetical protein
MSHQSEADSYLNHQYAAGSYLNHQYMWQNQVMMYIFMDCIIVAFLDHGKNNTPASFSHSLFFGAGKQHTASI